jgi:hypothetical protein
MAHLTSHTCTVLSQPPVARMLPSPSLGCQATEKMRLEWPVPCEGSSSAAPALPRRALALPPA